MVYILVENGKVVGNPRELPKNWANVSNFYVLDNQKLKEYGWYPYRFQTAEVGENETYDGNEIVIEENEVVEYQRVRTKTSKEIEEETDSMWRVVRNRRNRLLAESDWTQLPDSPLSNQNQTSWQVYRQSLRDITTQTNPFTVVWPTPPGV